MATDFAPTFVKKYHDKAVPGLLMLLDDMPTPECKLMQVWFYIEEICCLRYFQIVISIPVMEMVNNCNLPLCREPTNSRLLRFIGMMKYYVQINGQNQLLIKKSIGNLNS
jgi:hypothetical protein